MSKRMSLNLMQDAEQALYSLVNDHENWAYRTNTIIQAAIVAFSEMPNEQQDDYLKRVHRNDGRYV